MHASPQPLSLVLGLVVVAGVFQAARTDVERLFGVAGEGGDRVALVVLDARGGGRGATVDALPALPGEVRISQVTVRNDGRASAYSLRVETVGDGGSGLRDVMIATIRTRGSDCVRGDGQLLYDGPLAGAGFGDPAFGRQAGDRQLGSGVSEDLCLHASMPGSAGDAFQGAALGLRMVVSADTLD